MKKCHKARATKETEEATIWRMMPDKKRACVIGPIYNQAVGVMLEEMMHKSGKSAQSVVEEALVAYYESEYGFSVSIEAPVVDVVGNAAAPTVDIEDETAPHVEVVVVEAAPVVDVVIVDEEAPVVDVVSENEEAPNMHSEEVANSNSVFSWDENYVTAENFTSSEIFSYEQECNEDEDLQDAWSFEVDEEDDELELAPVDLLIEALQTATSWQEINEALKNNEEYKQEAWDALTPVERKRIIELTPPTIARLSNAKRTGLITDYRVEREGVYQVKQNGCLFWDIVFEYRVEEYFARL
ncbi:hypothetical protein DSM106972_094690 [Dulcicalothrix desertica PCC 7102]|uniref:Uncharacterized protein n=1 Tax=Dulcicalothrix desertica PCC 7102 TaxID=232991 RepID=A0A433UJH7_9CYAN|nr:hypothetical protein [Dulcicalothrix desertica]RUS93998.1 hypothetical protein DSM106972_094690 [Dulcicalothrix desertica PCC 7102]TWH62679.1 hypothetical protein CAL7102_00186 [Dulcicalothrix desertica PCC 7102]